MAPVSHILAIRYPAALSTAEVDSLSQGFKDLKHQCKKATGETYILSVTSGVDNQPASIKHQQGFLHVYIVRFASVEDRDYYAFKDLAHVKFGEVLLAALKDESNAIVIDYEEGNTV